MSILDVTGSRTAKGQTSANHMEALRISLNCVYSKMPHAITARRKVIYTQYVRPDCHKCSLKEDLVAKSSQTKTVVIAFLMTSVWEAVIIMRGTHLWMQLKIRHLDSTELELNICLLSL